jgi:predicted  nucleic acid-binding Zn-ribbon protein
MSDWEGDCSLLETLTQHVSIQLQTDTQMVDMTHMTEISPKKALNSANSSPNSSDEGEEEYDIETTCECEPLYKSQLATALAEASHWKEKYDGLLGTLDSVLNAMEDIQTKYTRSHETFAEEKASLIQEIEDLKMRNNNLEHDLNEFQSQESGQSDKLNSVETALSEIRSELSAAQNSLKCTQKELEHEKSQSLSLRSQLESQKTKFSQFTTEKEQTKGQPTLVVSGAVGASGVGKSCYQKGGLGEQSDSSVVTTSTTEQSLSGSSLLSGGNTNPNSQQYWRRVNTQQEPGETGAKARSNRLRNQSSNIFGLEEKAPTCSTPVKPSAVVQQQQYEEEKEQSQDSRQTTAKGAYVGQQAGGGSGEDMPLTVSARCTARCNRRNPQADFSPVPTLEAQVATARAKSPMKIDSPNDVPGIEVVMSKVSGERDILMDKLKQLEAVRPRTGEILKQRGKLNEEIDIVNSQLDSLKSKIRRIYSQK